LKKHTGREFGNGLSTRLRLDGQSTIHSNRPFSFATNPPRSRRNNDPAARLRHGATQRDGFCNSDDATRHLL
jgi:hypothetical protein